MAQFRALSEKNWILWKRSCCGNIIQIIVPIFFIAFLMLIRILIQIERYELQSFIGNSTYAQSHLGLQQTTWNAGLPFYLKYCQNGTIIGLIPSGNPFVTTLNAKITALGMTNTIEQFSSEQLFKQRIRSPLYGNTYPKFCFAVTIVTATSGGSYKYKLHWNQTIQDWSQAPASSLPLIQDQAINLQLYQQTLMNGMLRTTLFINNLIMQQQSGSTLNVFRNNISPLFQQPYERDLLYKNVKDNVQILFLLPLLIIYLRQTSVMLSQKQKRVRQTMNIMGMKLTTYYFTWFMRYFITLLVVHGIGSFIVGRTLKYVGYLIPFVIFMLFDIVLIIQSFFIQTFFSRAKIGVVIALLFFLLQYIISFLSSNSDNPTLRVNILSSIVPHVAFIMTFRTFLYAQSMQINASFTQNLNNYNIIVCIISCIANALFYLLLTWYLQKVFPNQFGNKQHPFFCCLDKNSKIHPQQKSNNNRIRPQIQPIGQKQMLLQKQKKIIKISHLRKQFNEGQLIAVNDLNLKIYNDNIFVLLGHNGAGKTTTISMLTGMLEPSSGQIQVFAQTQIQKIRQKIGVCPQHDTLYDDLTVQQHLELFGTFKGLSGSELEEQVNKLVADVNLAEKRHQYSKNLSGGQKRRLSVAMAFAGRSKVIILDEPTSGMDTSARRYIWELLKSYKTDRIILLTTHFMDEADYLGDRIGIMAGGQLICCGSGHFLKNRFGVGYNITFVKKDSTTSSSQISRTVQKHIKSAVVLSDVSSQITMQLPMDQIRRFPELFNEIDSKRQSLGITTYGISITTLQQVFLKVGEQMQKRQLAQINNKQLASPQRRLAQLKSSKHNYRVKQYKFKEEQDSPTKLNESEEAIKMRKKNSYRSMQLEDVYARSRNQLIQTGIQSNQKIQRIKGSTSRFCLHFKATILKRLRVIKRDYKSFILQLILPMTVIIFALLLMRISFITDLPQQQLNLALYQSQMSPYQIPLGASTSTLQNSIQARLTTKYGSRISVNKDLVSTTPNDFDQNFLLPKKRSRRFFPGGLFFNGQSSLSGDTIYQFTTLVNTRIPTSYLYLPVLAAQAYTNQIANKNIDITVVNAPFIRTKNQLQINNSISGTFGSLIFSVALAFKFASIISFIVKEREDKSKHQQIVSGMNIYAYWFGNFVYDYILYLILAAFSVGMCYVLQAQVFIGPAFGVTVVAFALYGLAYIPLTYIFAYIFKDYGNAQAGYYFFTFVIGGLITIIILVLRFLGGMAATVGLYLSWILRAIPAYSFGQILISLGSKNLLSDVQLSKGSIYSPWDLKISLFPIFYLGGQAILYTILLFILQKALNSQNFMRFWTSQSKIQETQQITDTDVLQMRKKALKAKPKQYEILTKNLRKVFMLDSQKKYKVAVDNLSVAIQKGEVFGLLGVNGAGKTTTFKMLAGQITSTSGDSYFSGMKISQNLDKVRQNLGYCPQFDALIQNLTVRQQIQMFYDLKSLPSQYKDDMVNQKIMQMNLQKYEDKLSGTLSGGNKRKLSVAMAMIGNPSIIFLDQPSTGMDPKARRFMWKIISRIASQKKQSTIILTTHSMQQAEALSTKLGIMVNGNFKCIGTPQHIKSKYGEGYQVQIKIVPCSKEQIISFMTKNQIQNKDTITDKQFQGFLTFLKVPSSIRAEISVKGSGNYIHNQITSNKKIQTYQIVEYLLLVEKINRIKQYMESRFGGAEVIQGFQTFIRFKVKGNLSVGKMFESLQTQKNKLQIDSYSIKQATVEQIFNRFAEDGQSSEMMA